MARHDFENCLHEGAGRKFVLTGTGREIACGQVHPGRILGARECHHHGEAVA